MKIGWSQFALDRHKPNNGFSWFDGTDEELFNEINKNWHKRDKGAGDRSIDQVCLVPCSPEKFISATIHVNDVKKLESFILSRREGENSFVKTYAKGSTIPVKFVKIVLYSKDELSKDTLDGKGYISPYDWEIVCIIASDIENEPMHPLAMARNQLEKSGGNPCKYTSEEWANAVWYWSQRINQFPSSKNKQNERQVGWEHVSSVMPKTGGERINHTEISVKSWKDHVLLELLGRYTAIEHIKSKPIFVKDD